MKQRSYAERVRSGQVAPYMGAWIETAARSPVIFLVQVAPYMGAWIETAYLSDPRRNISVAPYMGAWIENILSFCPFCC